MEKKIANTLVNDLLQSEHLLLDNFFKTVDVEQLKRLVDIIHNCKGITFLTGVGKSGLVAEKIAMTFTSTGTRAFFLSPTNALHGDIGIVTENDVFLLFSRGGESDELLNLIPALRNKRVPLIACTSNLKSRLVQACDEHIMIPFEKELCPFDLAPTISTTCQMIVGDILAVALMQLKKFSLDEYALNHPAGRIGRRITFKVQDLMISEGNLPLCHPNDHLVDILYELSDKRCGCILVVDENQILCGIFTDGDLRRALQKYGPEALNLPLEKLMIANPRFISPEDMAATALSVMEADQKHPITVLPVLDANRQVKGLIKMHDIVQTGL